MDKIEYNYGTYKKALDMILVRGLSYRETAKILNISVVTINRWMKEAKERSELIHRSGK